MSNTSSSSPTSCQTGTLPRSTPFGNLPKQSINTNIPLTVTPASAVSLTHPNASFESQRTVLSPSDSDTGTTNTSSLQPSPEGPRGRYLQTAPAPLNLPEPIVTSSSFVSATVPSQIIPQPQVCAQHQHQQPQTAMSEAINMTKGHRLIRRLSGKATNKLSRRRTSSTNLNRDRSSGPAVLRRRSDSNGGGFDNASSPVEAASDEESDRSPPADGAFRTTLNRKPSHRGPIGTGVAIGPVVPSILQKGTRLTKVTKKKRKDLKFALDIDSAKMYWDPSRASKSFYVDDIRELRFGADGRHYRKEFGVPDEFESCWFTIIYADASNSKGRAVKIMHLIAPNHFIFSLWTKTLESVSKYRFDMMASLANGGETSLKTHWRKAISNRSSSPLITGQAAVEETLGFEDIEDICRSLHIDCPRLFLQQQFYRADINRTGKLTWEEFKLFVRHVKERKDVQKIFEETATNVEAGLDLSEFLAFLRNVQDVDVDAELLHWESIFEKLARRSRQSKSASPSPVEKESTRMDLAAFAAFLSSRQYNSPLVSTPREYRLDFPISEYFVSSSHNTYLVGRQVAGESSTEPYIRALQRGCRCVEIDCWDGPDGRPVVTHGRTLTKLILFEDVINVVGKYAFVTSPYPLIISLEVHCNAEQQAVMTEIMKSTLGDKLLLEPFMTNVFVLPSPEELKHRILIKVKASEDADSESFDEISISRQHRALSSPLSRPVLTDTSSVPAIPLVTSPVSKGKISRSTSMKGTMGATSMSTSSATDDSDSREFTSQPERRMSRRKTNIVKPLGDLGVYTRGFKYSHFHHPNTRLYNHVYSLAERTFDSICRDTETKAELEKHNMRYLMRVYPSGFRINSSNFDPNTFWRRGVQMVALNWQTYDLGMQLNDAMFDAGTDRSGYVLKPVGLRRSRAITEPVVDDGEGARMKKQKKLVKFTVDIISGQQLPRATNLRAEDSISPYIEVETFCADDKAKGAASGEGGHDTSARNGMSGIGAPHRRRTGIVETYGYNPVFNEKITISVETKFPSLIFVRFTMYNATDGRSYGDRNAPLASFTAKFDSLRQGYHHLPLRNNNGEEYLFSTLFCRVQKEATTQLPVDRGVEDVKAGGGKVQSLRNLGRSVFNKTLSIERKNSRSDRSAEEKIVKTMSLERTSEELSLRSVDSSTISRKDSQS